MESSFEGQKPEILYPCIWAYQVIGADEEKLRAAVLEVVGERQHKLEPGNVSPGGKYRSMGLQARVEDERERLEIFERLSKHPAIRFVL
jgi:putative lipoic acid-binding regulatory protein